MPTGIYEHHSHQLFQKKHKVSKEIREKVRKAQKQLWQNPEYRKRMSEAHKGNKGYWEDKKRPNISKKNHYLWKGGKIKNYAGYIFVLKPSHPFAHKNGYIFEHRLVMEQHLGRYLKREERVHHKGIKYPIGSIQNKQDNRIKNLQLCKNESGHQKLHPYKNKLKKQT